MNRALQPRLDTDVLLAQIRLAYELRPELTCPDMDLVESILSEAQKFAYSELEALNAGEEAHAPTLEGGRVRLSPDHKAVWNKFVHGGWIGLDVSEIHGGMGLSPIINLAVQEIFDRSCPAFGMLAVSARSAVRLISAFGSDAMKSEWLGKLTAGEWAATICISEVGAGSDVNRMTTRANLAPDGHWYVTGEKNWISFGDHDATDRIGHCVLAKTANGISLFLVPNVIDGTCNNVYTRRIETKMGLHLSPTCAIGFEGARATLLGEDGKGLSQMFVMITNMRLAVSAMGLGMASGACDTAWEYAGERIQGKRNGEPVPIIKHPDVGRMLMDNTARVDVFRALAYQSACLMETSGLNDDDASESRELLAWHLPILKTLGGDISCTVSDTAIQVLGGAGYTREWPVEQSFRDSRVLPIFEGTTGIQAQDLLFRRMLKTDGLSLTIFLKHARQDLGNIPSQLRNCASDIFDILEAVSDELCNQNKTSDALAVAATHYLYLAAEASMTKAAITLAAKPSSLDRQRVRLAKSAEYFLLGAHTRAKALATQIRQTEHRMNLIAELIETA